MNFIILSTSLKHLILPQEKDYGECFAEFLGIYFTLEAGQSDKQRFFSSFFSETTVTYIF